MSVIAVTAHKSPQATPNRLDLTIPRYDKLGDVESGFTLTGYSLNIKGNVYGEIVSHEGNVDISSNVIQGSVRNLAGRIEVKGFISGAYIESINGEVSIKRAENSKIRAKKLTLHEARNCTLLAEEVEIGFMQNTVVTGKTIKVRTAAKGSGLSEREENLVVVEVPDLESLQRMIDAQQETIRASSRSLRATLQGVRERIARRNILNQDARVARYFAGLRQIRSLRESGQTIDAATLAVFMAEKHKIADELLELMRLDEAIRQLRGQIDRDKNSLEQARALKSRHEEKLAGLSCRIQLDIQNVTGETVVRKRIVDADTPCLREMADPVRLRRELGLFGDTNDQLFHAAKGHLHWEFAPMNPA